MHPDKSVARILSIFVMAFVAIALTACGGGGGGGGGTTTQSVGGGGVKGPLANAIVTVYAFDATAAGFKGAVIDTGTTNASAKITGLALTLPLAPPYILQFTSDGGTTDITTGMAPVITTMRTVLTQALLDNGEDIYATPLTTMATDLAIANAGTVAFGGDGSAPVTAAEFVAALPIAAAQVTSTLGFGLNSSIDIFDTPPLVDVTTDTAGVQANVAAYRAAVEAVTAIVYAMDQQNSGTTPDAVMSELTADLANDGNINGTTATGASTILSAAARAVLDQDPATLPIPNTGQTVGDVQQILITEQATTGSTVDTTQLAPGTGSITTVVRAAIPNSDIDGDGVLNANDAYPNDATADTDTDGDGAPDVAYTDSGRGTVDSVRSDDDDDNDGWLDSEDDFPTDATRFLDPALDRDGDGVANATDPCPLDATDACVGITDTDGDGIADSSDNCPTNSNPSQKDTDGDSIGDKCDDDIDGDTVLNTADAFPLDETETTDTDGDGIGNAADTDDDNDGVSDTQEGINGTNPLLRDTDGDSFFDNADAFPLDATEHVDTDGDTIGDNADLDDDADGVLDTVEIANGTKPLVADTDGDGINDGAEATAGTNPLLVDTDADGTNDDTDNCPVVANADQLDTDSDGQGNACDTDDDNDGVLDTAEAAGCSLLTDCDGDGTGDATDVFPTDATETVDTDSDTVGDNGDNCPAIANTDQLDTDGDGQGNVCDTDDDNDGLSDTAEAGLGTNPLLADTDGDGTGDATDVFPTDATETVDTDGDTVGDNGDNCPSIANMDQLDTDGDGQGNACDTDDDNDGLSDTAEVGLGTNPLLADTDADTIGDATDNCPTVSNTDQADDNTNGIGNACEATGGTGVWKTTATVTGLTDIAVGGCSGSDPVSTVSDLYMTMTQAGTVLTAKTVWGDSLTGTIDNGTGAFTLAGTSTFTDPFTGDVDTDTISVSGTVTTPTTWTGTVTITQAFQPSGGSSTDQCTETDSLASTFVYKHVAGEDYNGVYGLELLKNENGGSGKRDSFAVQFEISGSTMSLHLPLKNSNETFTNTSFDPNTGFFSFDLDGYEDSPDGLSSEQWHDKLTGILVRDPGEATLPTMALVIRGHYGDYDAIGGDAGTGNNTSSGGDEQSGYGKRLTSTGMTRGNYYRKNADGLKYQGIFMGMSHPPVKTATATSELYVEVLDGTTRLCADLYSSRYTNVHNEPAVDFTAEAFQPQFYSFVTCNTSTNTGGISTHNVVDTLNYTVRIMDTGADGVIDGGDDTAVAGASMVVAAEVNPSEFAELPSVNSVSLNGAATSRTMKQGHENGLIELFGFFDVNEDMNLSWTGITGAQKYWLEVKGRTADLEQTRFSLGAPVGGPVTETITLPAGTLDNWDGNVIRVRARKDGSDSNHRSLANSKWIQVQPGIRGLFNVELGGALGQALDTFQVWIDGNMGDGTTGYVNECSSVNQNWSCNAGASSIDYTTNTVHLNMTDVTGGLGTVTLDLLFGTTSVSDSGAGTVSSADVSLTPSQTSVRLANPELAVRTLKPSGGAGQQTMAVLVNTLGGATGFDKAVFKREDNASILYNGGTADAGTTALVSWCETGLCGTDKLFLSAASVFQMRPTNDGMAQGTGHFISDRAFSDWGIGAGGAANSVFDATTYKSVWTSTANPMAGTWVFKSNYAAPDASVLVTPIHNQVTVKLSGGDVAATTSAGTGLGETGNAINVTSQPAFGLSWTGSVPALGEWQIRVTYLSTTSGIVPPGATVRSAWMADGHPDLTESPVGTWTWTNGEGIALISGDVVRVQIVARDAGNTMLGAQRSGTTDDTIYLYIP